MKKKELVLNELKALGFDLVHLEDDNCYCFDYEELHILYLPSEYDDSFLRLAIPGIFEVTEDNRRTLLEIVNKMNLDLKYLKVIVMKDSIWLSAEHQIADGQPIGELLEFFIRMLSYSKDYFYVLLNRSLDTEETTDE